MIAALFVARGGVYFGMPEVDPWDEARDARAYAGPWPVVAHPPCERWGRYWHGGPTAHQRQELGNDRGMFAAALWAVRTFGGVLEHPECSSAWPWYGLIRPPHDGGWVVADSLGGWTCCVEQGHYGHRARKKTWLYACHVQLPSLKWGPSAARVKIDQGFHTAEERRLFMRPPANMTPEQREKRRRWLERHAQLTGKALVCAELMNKTERAATPIPFRDLLLSIARTARRPMNTAAAAGLSQPNPAGPAQTDPASGAGPESGARKPDNETPAPSRLSGI